MTSSTKEDSTRVFDGQVAGHGNIFILPNDTLLKRSTSTEINFYKLVQEKNIPIKKFMPKCYNFDPSFKDIKEKYIPDGDTQPYIHMENLLSPYQHATIMDLKLGTRLYDDQASEEKKQRMIRNAASTTSLKTGLKICGLHITDRYDYSVKKFDKTYGRALHEENIAHGILRFLLNFTTDTYQGVTTQDLEEDMDQEVLTQIPTAYTLEFLRAVLHETEQLREALAQSPIRIYGGSLCIIYETIKEQEELQKIQTLDPAHTNSTTSTALASSLPASYHFPFSLHLIDFAHASEVDPAQGEDVSLMTGIDRFISILQTYIKDQEGNKMNLSSTCATSLPMATTKL